MSAVSWRSDPKPQTSNGCTSKVRGNPFRNGIGVLLLIGVSNDNISVTVCISISASGALKYLEIVE